MNNDIRLSVGFKSHRKRIKLKRLLGAEGVLALVDLWLGVATTRSSGELTGWTEEDIAIEAQYDGDADEFVHALVAVGFLSKTNDGTYYIHDWTHHQRWACSAEGRSLAAQRKSAYRWVKQHLSVEEYEGFREWFPSYNLKLDCTAASIAQAYKQECPSNAQAIQKESTSNADMIHKECSSNAPLPYPSPLPLPSRKERGKNTFVKPVLDDLITYFLEKGSGAKEAETFFDHFSSNGWKIGGKAPMKDWKAASRNWIKRSSTFNPKDNARNRQTLPECQEGEPSKYAGEL